MKYKFTSKRVTPKVNDNQPDYDNVIEINGVLFTLTGWLKDLKSDIDYTLERVTEERLKNERFLGKKVRKYRFGG